MSHRIEKINKRIRTIFAELLHNEISLKQGVFVTIAKVDTSPDLKYTQISISIFPEHEEHYVLSTLHQEKNRLKKALHTQLTMKIRPNIVVQSDHTEQSADIIEKLLIELQTKKD